MKMRVMELLGAVVQGCGLGALVFVAVIWMLAMASDGRVFRYEGF